MKCRFVTERRIVQAQHANGQILLLNVVCHQFSFVDNGSGDQ